MGTYSIEINQALPLLLDGCRLGQREANTPGQLRKEPAGPPG